MMMMIFEGEEDELSSSQMQFFKADVKGGNESLSLWYCDLGSTLFCFSS